MPSSELMAEPQLKLNLNLVLPFDTTCFIKPSFLNNKIMDMKTCSVIFFCHYLLEFGDSARHTLCIEELTKYLFVF